MLTFNEWIKQIAEAREYSYTVQLQQTPNGDVMVMHPKFKANPYQQPAVLIFKPIMGRSGNYKIKIVLPQTDSVITPAKQGIDGTRSLGNYYQSYRNPDIFKIILGGIVRFLTEYKPATLSWANLQLHMRDATIMAGNAALVRTMTTADAMIQNAVAQANKTLNPQDQYKINGNTILNAQGTRDNLIRNPDFIDNANAARNKYQNDLAYHQGVATKFRGNRAATTQRANQWFQGLQQPGPKQP